MGREEINKSKENLTASSDSAPDIRSSFCEWIDSGIKNELNPLRKNHSISYYQNKLIIYGGESATGEIINKLEIYELLKMKWTTPSIAFGPTPPPLKNHTTVIVSDVLYLLGGLTSKDEINASLYCLNLKSKSIILFKKNQNQSPKYKKKNKKLFS